jgi:hypothetical protein
MSFTILATLTILAVTLLVSQTSWTTSALLAVASLDW